MRTYQIVVVVVVEILGIAIVVACSRLLPPTGFHSCTGNDHHAHHIRRIPPEEKEEGVRSV